MDGTRRVTLREAARELDVSVEAVRKRVKRRSLRSDKDPDGKVYVYLDASPDDRHPQAQDETSTLVEELRDRVRFMERQLEAERQAHAEARRLLAAALERIPPQLEEASQESPGASETASSPPDRGDVPPATGGAQTGAERPWWRRVFGGGGGGFSGAKVPGKRECGTDEGTARWRGEGLAQGGGS